MKLALLIPTRGDRLRFLTHCRYLISQQTRQPDLIWFVDYPPESDQKDITQRYRRGYDELRNQGLDAILMWEDDDWYAPNYIETMLTEWENAGKPDLFGPRRTEYYHIRLFEHFTMHHEQRTSAMSTLIRPDLNFSFPPDNEPYFDSWLWERAQPRLKGAVFTPKTQICLGIKHGIGLTGGNMHIDRLAHYQKHGQKDPDKAWLRSVVDPVSFEFYSNYF